MCVCHGENDPAGDLLQEDARGIESSLIQGEDEITRNSPIATDANGIFNASNRVEDEGTGWEARRVIIICRYLAQRDDIRSGIDAHDRIEIAKLGAHINRSI